MPVCNAELIACPQIPTTWPALDELIGMSGAGRVTPAQAPDRLLAAADAAPEDLHVWTVRAEFEGIRLLPVFEAVLSAWAARGGELVAVGDVAATLDPKRLPRHRVGGRTLVSGPPPMAQQEGEFLAAPEAGTRLQP